MTNFKGSIDQFLDHCSKLDADLIEAALERDKCIKEISTKMLERIQLEIVRAELDKLIKEGLVEITNYEGGQPVYSLTEHGKKTLDGYKEQTNKTKSKTKKKKNI
mgnify:CR=1 FL=1